MLRQTADSKRVPSRDFVVTSLTKGVLSAVLLVACEPTNGSASTATDATSTDGTPSTVVPNATSTSSVTPGVNTSTTPSSDVMSHDRSGPDGSNDDTSNGSASSGAASDEQSVTSTPAEQTDDSSPNADTGATGADTAAGGDEDTNTSYQWVPIDELPRVEEMPDPLTMFDGTKVTTPEQWRTRRREMIQILEDYEYGHMPPPPGNVVAEVVTPSTAVTTRDGLSAQYQMLHLRFGPDQSLGFDLGLFIPDGEAAATYPVLVSLTSAASENSLGSASAALARGFAVATVPYQQLGADSTNYKSTAFFPAYPDHDWRDFSAWAWGLSRAVDYLVTNPALDADKIMLTGVSRLGQAVLLAGAFDERVALSAPVAGGMAFRYSGKEMGDTRGQGITEIVDQNTYWFGPNFEKFRNRTPFLPSDQHWLLALTAPRLFIMSNSLSDEYGRAYAAVQSYVYAKPVYEFLGVPTNVGLHFREGGHGMNAEDWDAVLDFADQYLLGRDGTRRFDEPPPADQTP